MIANQKSRIGTQALFFCLCLLAASCETLSAETKTKRPDTSRAMFRTLGVDDAFFDQLADGPPLAGGEKESLLRILFRLRIFPPADLQRFAASEKELAAVISQPEQHRGGVFLLRGRALEIEPVVPDADAAQRYEMKRYYRCRLQLDDGRIAEIYTENVPTDWRQGVKPDADSGATAVFLKAVRKDKNDAEPVLIFAANRLAWYRDDLLGRLGFDYGLFDGIVDRQPIVAADREAFFQMLAAVGRAEPGQLPTEARKLLSTTPAELRWTNAEGHEQHAELRWTDRDGREQYSVESLFNAPSLRRGWLVELSGTVRRIDEIRIDHSDPDIVARFGFDRYYQVSLFTDDSGGNPLTFCIRELPEGMPFGNLPRYGEAVRISGFFFKTWSYQVLKLADPSLQPGNENRVQFSPLLIGRSLIWRPVAKPADNTTSNFVVGGLFLLVMVIIWIAAWRNRTRERKWLDKMESPPNLRNLNEKE